MEPTDPPNVPDDVLAQARKQARLVDEEDEPAPRRRRTVDEDRPSRATRPRRDDDEDRPSRRRRRDDDEYEEEDRPSRRRRDPYGDERDDFDDAPPSRRARSEAGNGLAIASMIVGIIGTVGALVGWCCCGLFGSIPSAVIGAVAVVLGFMSRSQGSRSGMNVTGIVLGFVAVVIGIVMSVLIVNETLSFNSLKELLDLTDGNLATHLRALEEQGYVLVKKQFVGRKPNTTYTATPEGRHAFTDHLNALEDFIRNSA